jgi:hypothetical protein
VFLCLDGEFALQAALEAAPEAAPETGSDRLVVGRGASAYVPAHTPQVQVQGRGTLLRVTTGRLGGTAPGGGRDENARTDPDENGEATR